MSETAAVQLFSSRQAVVPQTTTEAAVARAAQEVQAAMVIAKRFPRDETAAYNRILQACKRKSLAEAAVYSYPRGGKPVSGPSIRLAECIAQNWGNLDFGVIELDQRDGESSVMAYAWDLETNTRQTKVFTVKHERRVGKGKDFVIDVLTDPRDIYEMTANQGARRLRACILGVVPGDVVDAAVEACEATVQEKDEKMPLIDKLRKLPGYFEPFGVSQAMLEHKLGHKLDDATSKEYGDLRKIWTAIKDGVGKVSDYFSPIPTKPQFTDAGEGTDLGPQPKPAEQSPDLLRLFNLALKQQKLSEVDLLEYLRTTGKLDDSISSAQEAIMVAEPTMRIVYDHWKEVVAEIKRLKETK